MRVVDGVDFNVDVVERRCLAPQTLCWLAIRVPVVPVVFGFNVDVDVLQQNSAGRVWKVLRLTTVLKFKQYFVLKDTHPRYLHHGADICVYIRTVGTKRDSVKRPIVTPCDSGVQVGFKRREAVNAYLHPSENFIVHVAHVYYCSSLHRS